MNTRKTLPDFDTIFETAAKRLVDVGAENFSVCEVAETLNVSTQMLSPIFDDLYSFAASFGRYIDGAVVRELQAGSQPDGSLADEPARDRLFEVLMNRFDALDAYKDCARVLGKAASKDPKLGAVIAARLPQSMALMLSLAGLSITGYKKHLQILGLTGVWLRTARKWLKDDSADLSKTMAGLDAALKDAEGIAKRLF